MNDSPFVDLHPRSTTYRPIGNASVPDSYGDPEAEYAAVRNSAGLIDLNGNTRLRVAGPAATTLVQAVVARDVEFLFSERCLSALVLAEDGSVIDIVTIYRDEQDFILESSVGRGILLTDHLNAQGVADATVTDETATSVLIGLEGPMAWEWLGKVLGVELTGLPFQGVAWTSVGDAPAMVARTGVTGEFGYKILTGLDAGRNLWTTLAEDVICVGQHVVDVAMLEVRQPNPNLELRDGADPITCGFNWLAEPGKSDFIGRTKLLEFHEASRRRTVGFEIDGRPNDGDDIQVAGGDTVGTVLTTLEVPGTGRILGLARVEKEWAVSGLPIEIGSRAASTLSSPYTIPTSWSVSIV